MCAARLAPHPAMATTTATLLRSLLTRSDLERLDLGDAQVERWLQQGALSALGALKNDLDADERVFEVPDQALQTELAERLRPLGKPDVLLSPAHIRTFLRAAAGDGGADAAIVAALADRPEPAAPEQATTTASDPVAVAAAPPVGTDPDWTAPASAAHVEDSTDAEIEALMSPAPQRTGRMPDTDWFDISELEAAMGELLPMTETGVASNQKFAVPPAAPPAVNLPEDLYALAEMAHGHEQRLGELATTVATLTERVQGLERALVEADVLVLPEDANGDEAAHDEGSGAAEDEAVTPRASGDRRHVAVLTIASALSAWSVLLWFGTGSATLALSSLIAAAVLVALALGAARDASRPPGR